MARSRKLVAVELYDFTPSSRSACELALILNAIGRFRSAANSQGDLLAEAALRKPSIVVDADTGKRIAPGVYEDQVVVEAAIALGRVGSSAREMLPRLREELLQPDEDPHYRARQLAMAIAVARIGGKQQPDLATIAGLFRTLPEYSVDRGVTEELAALGKKHGDIGTLFRRHFLRLSRSQDISEDLQTWYSIHGDVAEMGYLAPFVHAARPSDRLCCQSTRKQADCQPESGQIGQTGVVGTERSNCDA